jgi:hypothetical protein
MLRPASFRRRSTVVVAAVAAVRATVPSPSIWVAPEWNSARTGKGVASSCNDRAAPALPPPVTGAPL